MPTAESQDERVKVGILAAGGGVPVELAECLSAARRDYHIVALRGFADERLAKHPHTLIGLGQLGGLLKALKENNCRQLVIIGSLARPDLGRLRFDLGALWHARSVLRLTRGGDDSMLRRIVRFFEEQGLTVVGAGDVAPDLLAQPGTIAGPDLNPELRSAIAVGQRALGALSHFDVGQAVIATADGIVAYEDASGTASLLKRLSEQGGTPPGAVLLKLPKLGQELRIDTPTIGAGTLKQAADAGVSAVVVGAGQTLVAERSRLAAAATDAGIPVAAIEMPDQSADQAGAGRAPWPRAGGNDIRQSLTMDETMALEVAEIAASNARAGLKDISVAVRRGHVVAIVMGGLANGRLTERLAGLPLGWRLPLPGWSTNGTLACLVGDDAGLSSEAQIERTMTDFAAACGKAHIHDIIFARLSGVGAPSDEDRARRSSWQDALKAALTRAATARQSDALLVRSSRLPKLTLLD